MRHAFILVASLLASACAAASAQTAPQATSQYGDDRVEKAARLLAIAADGEDAMDTSHSRAVTMLGRLGVHADEGQADLVGRWQAQLPPDASPPLRGRLLGPAYRSGTLAPGKSLTTKQLFEGGRQAKVSLSGKAHAPLKVAIRDLRDNAVCTPDAGNPRNCRWTPAYSARYEITITNPGTEPVTYFLVIG